MGGGTVATAVAMTLATITPAVRVKALSVITLVTLVPVS